MWILFAGPIQSEAIDDLLQLIMDGFLLQDSSFLLMGRLLEGLVISIIILVNWEKKM